ncbi:hypothetical protein [Sphaerisporangium aureirubrum]|uniref:Uncharacterized protein n=1 Tax=Sphaerisporangium aureirubrum TaxID=1544736 RepID=A0ABW1NDB8_9ACTN
MTCQPAAPIVEGLDLRLDVSEGGLVASAVLIAKVVNEDGSVSISISTSPGTSWLDELALVTAAREIVKPDFSHSCEDD